MEDGRQFGFLRPVRAADLDQPAAREADGQVVRDPMGAMNHEVAWPPIELLEAQDPVVGIARDRRRGRQEEPRRGTAADERRLIAGNVREPPADRRLQLDEIDEALRRLAHRLEYRRRHQRSTQDREGRAPVDDRLDAQAAIDVAARHVGPELPASGHRVLEKAGPCGGVPGRIRTCDLPLRRRLLWSTELRGRAASPSYRTRRRGGPAEPGWPLRRLAGRWGRGCAGRPPRVTGAGTPARGDHRRAVPFDSLGLGSSLARRNPNDQR